MKDAVKSLLNDCFSMVLVCMDSLICLCPSGKKRKGILLVKLDAIGDFFIWLDQAGEYRKIYPDERIVLAANSLYLSLASSLPYWDKIIPVHVKKYAGNPLYRLKKNIELKKLAFKKAINPVYSRSFVMDDSVIHLCNADIKIGSKGNNSNIKPYQKKISNTWYTKLIPSSEYEEMELIRNAKFLRALGQRRFRAGIPVYHKSFGLNTKIQSLLPDKFYIIFPGAGRKYRQWPADNFVRLVDKISKKISVTPVICGGPGEESLGHYIALNLKRHSVNLVNKTSLQELVQLVRDSMFVVANETSAVHIAAAVNTPSICILGGGHFERFVPYKIETSETRIPIVVVKSQRNCFGCDWRRPCIGEKNETSVVHCIRDISVNQVWEKMRIIINSM
ncbi:glycosyltransferase family 9 protein [uncultured Desulfobacter sp.]|uniref:glycosyltransferase family 9 protein n=1 Tax=uncultured Desulfobacter sp. TaxID=240139 RepID=UPI0029F4690B|nr:glycosyltransferase family 9 protein [uncultured Desulfobacter sp.]